MLLSPSQGPHLPPDQEREKESLAARLSRWWLKIKQGLQYIQVETHTRTHVHAHTPNLFPAAREQTAAALARMKRTSFAGRRPCLPSPVKSLRRMVSEGRQCWSMDAGLMGTTQLHMSREAPASFCLLQFSLSPMLGSPAGVNSTAGITLFLGAFPNGKQCISCLPSPWRIDAFQKHMQEGSKLSIGNYLLPALDTC